MKLQRHTIVLVALTATLIVPVVFTYVDDAQLAIGRLARRLGLQRRPHDGAQGKLEAASA